MTIWKLNDALSLSFGLDALGLFFLVLVTFIFAFVLSYASVYMKHEGGQRQFYLFYGLTWLFLVLLAMAKNAATLYMCFEMMSLCSMPLVLHNGQEASRSAAFKYIGYSTLGASLALFGFFLFAQVSPGMEFVPGGVTIPENLKTAALAAYLLIFLGFGAKAGLVPLQMWLTEAHPVAPSPASAVLSGLITKGGVFAILRCTFFLFGADAVAGTKVQTVLIILTLITIFTGSMLALREKLLKKRLAYSTVSQVSYVLFGVLTFTTAGFSGAMLQFVFHALAKDALFLAAGGMIFATGLTHTYELRGIGRRMPVTLWCFTIGALSLVGIPPTGGFIAKWYLALGALEGGTALGIVGVAVLMVSALLTAFYLLPIMADGFFPGKDWVPERKCELPMRMLLPMGFFAALLVVLGMYSGGLYNWFTALAGTLM